MKLSYHYAVQKRNRIDCWQVGNLKTREVAECMPFPPSHCPKTRPGVGLQMTVRAAAQGGCLLTAQAFMSAAREHLCDCNSGISLVM